MTLGNYSDFDCSTSISSGGSDEIWGHTVCLQENKSDIQLYYDLIINTQVQWENMMGFQSWVIVVLIKWHTSMIKGV